MQLRWGKACRCCLTFAVFSLLFSCALAGGIDEDDDGDVFFIRVHAKYGYGIMLCCDFCFCWALSSSSIMMHVLQNMAVYGFTSLGRSGIRLRCCWIPLELGMKQNSGNTVRRGLE